MAQTDTASSGEYPAAINEWLDKEPGNSFTQGLVSYDQAPSKFAKKDTVIATFKDDDGDFHSLWLSATVLVSQFARVKPVPGEIVTVKFLGRKDSGGPNSYKDYRVTVPARPPFVPDWKTLSDELDEDDEDLEGGAVSVSIPGVYDERIEHHRHQAMYRLGNATHSTDAATLQEIQELLLALASMPPDGGLHYDVSQQDESMLLEFTNGFLNSRHELGRVWVHSDLACALLHVLAAQGLHRYELDIKQRREAASVLNEGGE